jgi:hypothetical protein
VSWDLKDHAGQSVPIKAEHILRVQPKLLRRLFAVVAGDAPPDEDPEAAADQAAAEAQRELAAALAGVTPAELDEKNSGPASS